MCIPLSTKFIDCFTKYVFEYTFNNCSKTFNVIAVRTQILMTIVMTNYFPLYFRTCGNPFQKYFIQ